MLWGCNYDGIVAGDWVALGRHWIACGGDRMGYRVACGGEGDYPEVIATRGVGGLICPRMLTVVSVHGFGGIGFWC